MKFADFYIFYLSQHQNKTCRAFHAIGTTLVIVTFIYTLISKSWMCLLLMPLFGYGFSWVGHFSFERNKPAAFNYPFYSLISDFVMYGQTWTGKLADNLDKARITYPEN